MENENKIRGAVFSKYPSIEAFAKQVGWKRNKASRIINGVQKPSADDIEQMANCLEITNAELFVSIFFPGVFTMRT